MHCGCCWWWLSYKMHMNRKLYWMWECKTCLVTFKSKLDNHVLNEKLTTKRSMGSLVHFLCSTENNPLGMCHLHFSIHLFLNRLTRFSNVFKRFLKFNFKHKCDIWSWFFLEMRIVFELTFTKSTVLFRRFFAFYSDQLIDVNFQ